MRVGDVGVWATAKDVGTVYRIDPSTNTVVAEIATGSGAHDLVIDEHGVLVANYCDNTVTLVDPNTNDIVVTINDLGSGVGITAGAGYIWVSTRGVGITRIDPQTYETTVVFETGAEGNPEWNYGVAYGEGDLWVSSTMGWVYRVPLPAG